MKLNRYFFLAARPVWEFGEQTRMNHTVSFVSTFEKQEGCRYTLSVAASSIYLLTVNGRFVAYGPAGCATASFPHASSER